MSVGRLLTIGLGTPYSNVHFLPTLGLGTAGVTPTPTPAARGGDDVPRTKSPDRGFDLAQWKARQIDFEGSIREAYSALMQGPLVVQVKEVVAPYVQTSVDNEVDFQALSRDSEALEEMLLLLQAQEEEEAVTLLLLQ